MSLNTDELRQQIDDEHKKALDALAVIQKYLSGTSSNGAAIVTTAATSAAKPKTGFKSFREQVLGIITDRAASVQEIVKETGLPIRKIRGVINAPGITEKLERGDNANGQRTYKMPRQETT